MYYTKKHANGFCRITCIGILILGVLFLFLTEAEAGSAVYIFDPAVQHYELYPTQLILWGTEATGHQTLRASTDNYEFKVLQSWLGMIMSAQALSKKVTVHYDPANGRIWSIYGPK